MKSMLEYYPLATAEGEGAGTAYEYYVKARMLKKIFSKTGNPSHLLIAGLPERYGFSMDFILLAQELSCQHVMVMDERQERLEQFVEICRKLSEAKIINCPKQVEIRNNLHPEAGAKFDFFISCEVMQRLSADEQKRYWNNMFQAAKAGVIFTPNAENPDHATHSNLRTVRLSQLVENAQAAGGKIINSGYIDMPPFPPGITRSEEQRESADQGIYRLAFKVIEQWAKMECLVPTSIRQKSAHIVFAAAEATR